MQKKISISSIACYLFLLYWLLKPYYLFSSGGLQIADFIMVLSFGLTIFDSRKLTIRKIDLSFIVFVVMVAIINCIYTVLYQDSGFIKSILYYVFNLIAIILFVRFSSLISLASSTISYAYFFLPFSSIFL